MTEPINDGGSRAAGDEDMLSLDPEGMRRSGYRAVDLLVELLSDVGKRPALTRATPEEMRQRLAGPPPGEPSPIEDVLDVLARDVLPFTSRPDHPRYFAFVPTSGTWPGALGDFVASALSIFAGAWMEAAGPTQVELEVVRWFREWIGLPPEAAGVLVSGGSAANMTALACAREARLGAMTGDAVAYVSTQAHSSVARAARVLGFRPEQVRILPVDSSYRLRPDMLAAAIAADRAAGLRPLLVSASAGSTSTGAVDPLHDIADICEESGAWLHIDAAYGGFAALTARGKAALAGIERADSVTLDPHKWFYQPFECGCLLVRDGRVLRQSFAIEPVYLHDAGAGEGEVNFSDLGMQLSRSSRALKVWLSVRTFGLDAFRTTIDRCLDMVADAERAVLDSTELELLNPASLGILCFRRRPSGVDSEDALDAINAALVASYAASGEGLVSSTRLQGRYAIRLCVLNHTTTPADVAATLEWFASAPLPDVAQLVAAASSPPDHRQARDPDVAAVWGHAAPSLEGLSDHPLFALLDREQLEAVARVAWQVEVSPGDAVVRRFEASREFYALLEGCVEVLGADGELLNTLGTGDYFGELAALDWGAGYGSPRLATVVATTPVRLAVLPGPAFNELLRTAPALERHIRRTANERARGL